MPPKGRHKAAIKSGPVCGALAALLRRIDEIGENDRLKRQDDVGDKKQNIEQNHAPPVAVGVMPAVRTRKTKLLPGKLVMGQV